MAEPHRYEEYGGKCRCGLDRWHAAHFGGDGVAASVAYDQHMRKQGEREAWERTLAPGMSVMISEDHPSADLAGQVGQLTSRGSLTVEIKTPSRQVNVKIQWVRPVPLPEPPPKFNSPEEADRWLEDTAREMGLKVGPDVPQFASQEEADEWLERQAGEPYVPPSWRKSGTEWVTPDHRTGLTTGAYERKAAQVRGQHPQLIVMDEAAQFPEVIDPYNEP